MKRTGIQQRSWLMVSFLMIGFSGCLTVQAQQEASTEEDRKPLYFRKVYVPADNLDAVIKGTMPLKRKSFLDMVDAINRSAQDGLRSSEVRVVAAKYSARLAGDDLVDGVALLEIEKAAGDPVMLSLSPHGLAWGRPQWEAETAAPALAGMDATGDWFVLVEKSGRLRIPWSLKGKTVAANQKQFDLWVPPSATNRLDLQLPEKMLLSSNKGLVLPALKSPGSIGGEPKSDNQPTTPGQLIEDWVLQLGGHQRALLTVAPQDAFEPREALVLYRKSTRYELARTGVNLEVDLHVNVHHQPVRKLTVRFDRGVHLLTAQLGKEALPWTVQETAMGEQVTIHFTKPLSGADRVISFVGTAPLVAGKDWQLPAVHVMEGVWQEEQASIAISKDLRLVKLQADGCHETAPLPENSPELGELRRFQFYQPGASIELALQRRVAGIHLETGTRIDIVGERLSGLVVADATATYGQQFILEGNLATGWIVDAVETEPPEFLSDYHVTRSKKQRQLAIRLNRAIKEGQDVRVIVRAHSRMVQKQVAGTRLRMVDFQSVESSRSVVAVGVEEGFQLRVSRDRQLQRLEPTGVSDSLVEALDLDSTALLFLDQPGAENLLLQLLRQQPRYSSELHVQALFGPERLEEQYRITCTPENAPLQRVLVHFYRSRGLPMHWTVQGDATAKLVYRMLDAGEQELRGLSGGETWEVSLDQFRLEPFQLVGIRNVPIKDSVQICLAATPESVTQAGSLSVLAADAAELEIESDLLKRVPVARQLAGRTAQIRGAYDYDPSQDAVVKVARRQAVSSQEFLWAWDCQLHSRFTTSGHATHRAVYRLENRGGKHFELYLPAGAELQELIVDQEVIGLVGAQRDARELKIPLPLQSRFPVVQVSYSIQSPILRIFAGVKAPLPKVECAVLHTQWQVLLPPGYALFTREVADSDQQQGLSIGRRLFGPLFRDSTDGPFRLLALSDWQQITGQVAEDTGVQQQADECIRHIGQAFQLAAFQAKEPEVITWHQVLENYLLESAAQDQQKSVKFWVDREVLTSLQIDTKGINDRLPEDLLELGRELLTTAHLSLLVSREAMVLTTRSKMREVLNSQRIDEKSVVQIVAVNRLAAQIRKETGAKVQRWAGVQQWLGQAKNLASPWLVVRQVPYTQISDSRWSRHVFSMKPGDESRLVVCRPLVLHSFAWAGLLIWTGLFTWLFSTRPMILVRVILLSGLVALLAPGNIYPAPTCLFLGSLLAGLLVLTWRHADSDEEDKLVGSELSFELQPIPKALVSILLLLGLAGWTLRACADDPVDQQSKKAGVKETPVEKVYRLLIPVDEKKQPVGQYDYLPETFFDELHRRAAKVSQRQERLGWLMKEAQYLVDCDWLAVRNGQQGVSLVATVHLDVLQPDQTVSVQIPRETVELSEPQLNGQEIPLNWSAEGDAFLVEIEEAGACVLQYRLRPIVRSIGGKRAVQFRVPGVPMTQLRFPNSAEMPEISILKSLGAVGRQLPSGDLVANLGGCGQLGFAWTWQAPVPKFPAQTSVEQLTWMKVSPHSVVVDTQFRFSVLRGKVEQVQLRVDPRLRILPLRAGQLVRGTPRIREGDINTILVELREPMDRDFTLPISFYMNETSGVGQLQVPTLEAVTDRIVSRQLGVSVSERLQWESTPVAKLMQMTPEQFAQKWGAPDPPNLALRLATEELEWKLATRRRVAQTKATQQLDVKVAEKRLLVEVEMAIETTDSPVFQHRLQLPTGFRVQQVILSQEEQELSIRTAVSDDQQLTVFLSEGVIGKQQLQVSGELLHNGKTANIPQLELETGELTSRQIRVYRQPEVLVQVTARPTDEEVQKEKFGQFQVGLGRLVAAWDELPGEVTAESQQRTLSLRPNQSLLQTRSVTQVYRRESAWWSAIDCHVNVSAGVCDELQLDIPEAWGGQFQLTPSMPFEIKRLPGIPQRRLVIRPENALAGSFQVRVAGPLVLPAGGVRVPEIQLLGVQRSIRYVVMPNRLDQQKLAWEISGLQRIEALPKPLAAGIATVNSTVARVVADHFRARIKEVQQFDTAPFIHLADVRVGWTTDGECSGVATFDLEPAGRTECVLQVPAQYRLVSVRVAGLPGVLQELETGRFKLQLGPSQLAQRIEVVYRGQVAIKTSVLKRVKTVAPTIEGFPVGQTLWTVRSPNSVGTGRSRNSKGTATVEQHVLQRLGAIIAILETVTENGPELTTKRMNDWFQPWKARFLKVEGRRNQQQSVKVAEKQESDLLATRARYQELKDRLGVSSIVSKTDPEVSSGLDLGEVWQTVVVGSDILGQFEGQQTELELVYPGMRRSSDFGLRFLVGLGWLLAAGCGWHLQRRGILGEWWARWPYVAGVCLGLVWWLWLRPSLLGLVIMALSALAAVIPSWVPQRPSGAISESMTVTAYPKTR